MARETPICNPAEPARRGIRPPFSEFLAGFTPITMIIGELARFGPQTSCCIRQPHLA